MKATSCRPLLPSSAKLSKRRLRMRTHCRRKIPGRRRPEGEPQSWPHCGKEALPRTHEPFTGCPAHRRSFGRLGYDPLDHVARDVGEPEVASLITVGQPGVIDAAEIKHRGV